MSNTRSLQIKFKKDVLPIGLDNTKGLVVFSVFRFKVFTMVWEINVCDALESNRVEITFSKIRTLPSKAAFPLSLSGDWVNIETASMHSLAH